LVRQARSPWFYADLGVPDTPEGRFEAITLHTFLIIHRLNQENRRTSELSQQLFDVLFGDMDSGLREMGVGDVGVGKRLKRMIQDFYGRAAAYEQAIKTGGEELKLALARNVLGNTAKSGSPALEAALAVYVREQITVLSGQDLNDLLRGEVSFGPPPETAPCIIAAGPK
jgi:cytochrome b pre-mRNA-processing protein 3